MTPPSKHAWLQNPHWGAWAIITVVAISLFLRYPGNLDAPSAPIPTDFGVYMKAWQNVSAGKNPYVESDASPYKYAPGALAFFKLLPDKTSNAWFVFGTLSVVSLALALAVGAYYTQWRSVGLLVLGLIFAWKGILETLDYGQLELLILGAAVAAAGVLGKVPFLSGLLIGTLPWFKLPWVLLLIPFLAISIRRGEKKLSRLVSGYLSACFLWGAAIPSLLYGSDRALALSQDWVRLLRSQPKELYYSDINQSIWISAVRWLGGASLTQLEIAVGIVSMGSAVLLGWLMNRPSRNPAWQGALPWCSPWLLIIQILNPLSWRWGSAFLVGVPLAVLGGARRARAGAWVIFGLTFILWALQQNPIVQLLGYQHWTDLHRYGVVTAYWVLFMLATLWPRGQRES